MSSVPRPESPAPRDHRPEEGRPTRERRGDAPWQQDRLARRRRQVSAEVVHEAIRFEGEEELDRTSAALFWSALAAGLTMGLSFLSQGALRSALPDAPWRPLVDSLGYTVGFLFVIAARQQLFTENTLTPVLPLLHRWSHLPDVARLWAVVLVANILGATLFALAAALTPLLDGDLHTSMEAIAREVIAPASGTIFIRAIAAGWLIALMVWLLPAAEHARVTMIVLPTYLIALTHLAHSIAGSVDVLYLVARGGASLADYARFIALALAGNVIGGVTLVAALNHAQVRAGKA